MSQLSLSNVVNISVSEAQQGAGKYNVNNLAIFSSEPFANSFGPAGYGIYRDPAQVGIDFGTNSTTFKMANAAFSQAPNMLAGGGYLAVLPLYTLTQVVTPNGMAGSGTIQLKYGGGSVTVGVSESASTLHTAFQTLVTAQTPGVTVAVTSAGTFSTADAFTFTFSGGPSTLPIILGTNSTDVSFDVSATYETLAAAITRTVGLVQYFGITSTTIPNDSDMLAAAAVVQALNKIAFFPSRTEADIEPGGQLDQLTTGDFDHSRGLYYGVAAADVDALVMAASYAGRGLSTNFTGSNTTSTMHLKDLTGVQPDLTLTQTLLNKAIAAGADTYPSLQGVPKVYTSGANKFYDQVYNLLAFVGDLQIAGFNYLAESSTKIPQTEGGMIGLKGAYRTVCQQYVNNQYLAPGQWNSSTTFGNQADFLSNVLLAGYYLYSAPVSQQSQADRVARKAPLCQLAVKEAGAIQSSNLIIYVNA